MHIRERIIPAYAGSTPRRLRRPVSQQDHPRIRGEHGPAVRCYSPASRIIPAYAGSTMCRAMGITEKKDHPRIRGEHGPPTIGAPSTGGSSPHTRGAPVVCVAEGVLMRIIPAYAGSTRPPTRPPAGHADHPRIRGEHASFQMALRAAKGSSPHTRGAPLGGVQVRILRGIIPAYAGSTGYKRHRGTGAADHPRIRGEHE